MVRHYSISRIKRAFNIYKRLSVSQQGFQNRRAQGMYGIAVDNDELAIKWRSYEFRMHVIDQWINGNSINWFYASWLTSDEAEKRNDR